MKRFLIERYHALKNGRNHWLRKTVGVVLVILGLAGFLPVLGFWMIPLGLALLAVDFPVVRRFNHRAALWWQGLRYRLKVRLARWKPDRSDPDR